MLVFWTESKYSICNPEIFALKALHHTNMPTVFSDVTRQIYMGSLSSASLSTGIYTPFRCVLCSHTRKINQSPSKTLGRTSWHSFSISAVVYKSSSCFHRKSHCSQTDCSVASSFQAGDIILTHSLYLASSVHVDLLIPKHRQFQKLTRRDGKHKSRQK